MQLGALLSGAAGFAALQAGWVGLSVQSLTDVGAGWRKSGVLVKKRRSWLRIPNKQGTVVKHTLELWSDKGFLSTGSVFVLFFTFNY